MRNGWWSEVPTPALVVLLQFWDDDAVFQRVQGRMGISPNSLSAWEKLLLARHCARVLERPDVAVVPPSGQAASPDPDLTGYPLDWPAPSRSHDEALQLLRMLGPGARPAVPALIRCLDEPAERGAALAILAQIGPGAGRAIGPVIALTADPDFHDYPQLFPTLKSLHASSEAALAMAVRVVKSRPELDVKREGARFIAAMASPERANLAFQQLLKEPDFGTRIAGAAGLEAMGPRATPSIPAVVLAIRDRDFPLRVAGAQVLTIIGNREAIDALGELATEFGRASARERVEISAVA